MSTPIQRKDRCTKKCTVSKINKFGTCDRIYNGDDGTRVNMKPKFFYKTKTRERGNICVRSHVETTRYVSSSMMGFICTLQRAKETGK